MRDTSVAYKRDNGASEQSFGEIMEVLAGSSSRFYAGSAGSRYCYCYSLGRPDSCKQQQRVICRTFLKDTDVPLQRSSRVREQELAPVLQVLDDDAALWKKDSPPGKMGSTDTSLISTIDHKLWVLAGCSSLLAMLAKSAAASLGSPIDATVSVLAAISGYVLADLATGIYHWGIDNYGDAKTPVFGAQIDAFQGHHKRPWTITKREFANNIHSLARPAAVFLLPVLAATPGNGPVDAFLGVFLGCVVFSQQFHAWAHTRRGQLPGAVRVLQDAGVLVSTRVHGKHHREPFDCNYCIVSGLWNGVIDESGVLKVAERFVYDRWGYVPRCWDETAGEWMQEGSYFEDG